MPPEPALVPTVLPLPPDHTAVVGVNETPGPVPAGWKDVASANTAALAEVVIATSTDRD